MNCLAIYELLEVSYRILPTTIHANLVYLWVWRGLPHEYVPIRLVLSIKVFKGAFRVFLRESQVMAIVCGSAEGHADGVKA